MVTDANQTEVRIDAFQSADFHEWVDIHSHKPMDDGGLISQMVVLRVIFQLNDTVIGEMMFAPHASKRKYYLIFLTVTIILLEIVF